MTGTAWNVGTAPWGRKLNRDEPAEFVGYFGSHRFATEERLERARQHFPEATLEDFDHVSEHAWIDKATGTEFRSVGSDPLASANPRSSQIACFVIDEYGDIAYLRKRGDFGQVESVKVGTMSGGPVDLTDMAERTIY